MKRLFFIAYFFIEKLLAERCMPRLSIVAALANGHIERGSAIIRVRHSCGHMRWRRELGDKNERESKREFLQNHVCADCWGRER